MIYKRDQLRMLLSDGGLIGGGQKDGDEDPEAKLERFNKPSNAFEVLMGEGRGRRARRGRRERRERRGRRRRREEE